jgi:hypothetical protein
MTYKAQVIHLSKVPDKEAVKVVVAFISPNETVQREFIFGLGFSEEQLKEQIRLKVQQLESIDSEMSKIKQDADIDYSKKQESIDADDLVNKVNRLSRIKTLLDLGVIVKSDVPELTTLKSDIKALFKKLDK